jgi:SAM-dependent methyltransferase
MLGVFAARLRAIPKYGRAIIVGRLPVPSLATAPSNPLAWASAADRLFDELPLPTQTAITAYEIRPSSKKLIFFADDIERRGGNVLLRLSKGGETASSVALAIDEIVRQLTIAECAYAHRAGAYFTDAEAFMSKQWTRTIWPIIHKEDLTHSLDLACGHGRNTEFLRQHAVTIDLVDVNRSCIETCRSRFGKSMNDCTFRYHVNDGKDLSPVVDSSISFVYSWDSMVHFDKLVVADYIREIARVLSPGGSAFLHHSNFGSFAPDSNWTKNHGSRSNMTAELMREYAVKNGLFVKFQRLSGTNDGWGMDDLDCLSLLGKPY